MSHSIDKLVQVFLKIRDARAVMKAQYDREYAKLGEQQERIEAELLRMFNEMGQGIKNVKTAFGTAYREPEWRFQANDHGAYWQWARENDFADAFEHRVGQRFVKDYMDTNNGDLPPGVSGRGVDRIRVRVARN